jgi:hypothetical protein
MKQALVLNGMITEEASDSSFMEPETVYQPGWDDEEISQQNQTDSDQ